MRQRYNAQGRSGRCQKMVTLVTENLNEEKERKRRRWKRQMEKELKVQRRKKQMKGSAENAERKTVNGKRYWKGEEETRKCFVGQPTQNAKIHMVWATGIQIHRLNSDSLRDLKNKLNYCKKEKTCRLDKWNWNISASNRQKFFLLWVLCFPAFHRSVTPFLFNFVGGFVFCRQLNFLLKSPPDFVNDSLRLKLLIGFRLIEFLK